jgi:hypothetical protein
VIKQLLTGAALLYVLRDYCPSNPWLSVVVFFFKVGSLVDASTAGQVAVAPSIWRMIARANKAHLRT